MNYLNKFLGCPSVCLCVCDTLFWRPWIPLDKLRPFNYTMWWQKNLLFCWFWQFFVGKKNLMRDLAGGVCGCDWDHMISSQPLIGQPRPLPPSRPPPPPPPLEQKRITQFLQNCIWPTICIGQEIQCLQYAEFFLVFRWNFIIVLTCGLEFLMH